MSGSLRKAAVVAATVVATAIGITAVGSAFASYAGGSNGLTALHSGTISWPGVSNPSSAAVLVLSADLTLPAETKAFIDSQPSAQLWGIGSPGGAALLLAPPTGLIAETGSLLSAESGADSEALVFGGTGVVSDTVLNRVGTLIGGVVPVNKVIVGP